MGKKRWRGGGPQGIDEDSVDRIVEALGGTVPAGSVRAALVQHGNDVDR
jgi:hypothetical protein